MRAAVTSDATLCEIGPVEVQTRCATTGTVIATADPELAGPALAFDEPVAVVRGQPVRVGELWERILQPLLADTTTCTLVYPSWWPPRRVGVVATAAETSCGQVDVTTRARSWVTRSGRRPLLEIAPELVLLADEEGTVVGVRQRDGSPVVVAESVAELVLAQQESPEVGLDVPAGVPGGDVLAELITGRLRRSARTAHRVGSDWAAVQSTLALPVPVRGRRWNLLAAAVVPAGVVLSALAWPTTGPVPATASTSLVEGRVSTEVPADWSVRRVTGGPGSARVEIVAPDDPQTLLHLTQARVASSDLAATAKALIAAMADQPPGVFVDFNPADVRAGRPAVTYREIRSGRDITWTVVVDRDVRIAIGCQASRDETIDVVCEHAVRTARRIG